MLSKVASQKDLYVALKADAPCEFQIISLIHVRDGVVAVTETGIARTFESSNGVSKWDVNLAASSNVYVAVYHRLFFLFVFVALLYY